MRNELETADITQLTVVTQQGVKFYTVGHDLNGEKIHFIDKGYLYSTGDPYDHYLGLNEKGDLIFSVNCMCPCDIEYKSK